MANILRNALNFSSGINYSLGSPFDSRLVVQTKSDLITNFNPDNALAHTAYGGMVVTVADENRTYILKSIGSASTWKGSYPTAADPTKSYNWVAAGNVTEIYNGSTINPSQLSAGMLYIFDSTIKEVNAKGVATGTTYPSGMYFTYLEGTGTTATVKLKSVSAGGQITDAISAITSRVSALENTVNGVKSQPDEAGNVTVTSYGLVDYVVNGWKEKGVDPTKPTEETTRLSLIQEVYGYKNTAGIRESGLKDKVSSLEARSLHAAISTSDVLNCWNNTTATKK